ncbi:MAG: hypothetical protein RLZZ501_783 [Pseudomonadota bacterium]
MTAIRAAAVAGQFYPADPDEVRRAVAALLAAAPPAAGPVPKAIVVPHAGWVYSGPTAAVAYARLIPARDRIRRVVLAGPAHRVALRGQALSAAEIWDSPLGPVALDQEGARRLAGRPGLGFSDQAHLQEHALEVQLPFLQTVLGDGFRLLPIVIGDAAADSVAATFDAVWGGPETLIVVSTDLSHYLDYQSCRRHDAATAAAIERFDAAALALDPDSACGRVPLAGLLLAAKRRGLAIEPLDRRNSGDTAGSRDRVVGYGAWALTEPEAGAESEADRAAAAIRAAGPALLDLAWGSIRHGLATGRPAAPPPPDHRPGPLAAAGAAFVTLTRFGQLRGCIGSPQAWRPLAEDVVDNAFAAAFRDSRFPPLADGELPGLDLAISVLTPPEPLRFADEADLLAQLHPRRDGLIIEDQGRRALFLPVVWEQLPEPRAFLAHLKLKAGLAAGHWSPGFRASRFAAVEIGPER